MTIVGVVGASARAAVQSLARAGYAAWAVDQFGDRDLARVAPCAVCPPGEYPDALPRLAAQFPPGPVLYTGGLENHPHIVAQLAQTRELWGNPPDVLARVRDPHLLAAYGFASPRLAPPGDPCPTEGHWLRKPLRSGGGIGIRFAESGEPAAPDHYFQEWIDGVPMSALFGTRDVGTLLLGTTAQLIGEPWLHAAPFAYCGNISLTEITRNAGHILTALGSALSRAFQLSGVWGVDFLPDGGQPQIIELNPRYTASVEVIEHGLQTSLAAQHIAGYRPDHRFDRRVPSYRSVGKAVYYAPHAITFPQAGPWDADLAEAFDPWRLPAFADIPHPGSAIQAGWPVLTFFATGSTAVEVRQRLQSRAAELDHLFAEHSP